MPTPNQGEDRKTFINRCMGDVEANNSFPDSAQRFKFCESQWASKGVKKFDETETEYSANVSFETSITKLNQDKQLVYGWFSVIEKNGQVVVDREGDMITVEELMKTAHQFVSDSRVAGIIHKDGVQVGRVVESMVFTKDVQKALGIDLGQVGWFGVMKITNPGVWKLVKEGKLPAFSIGGVGVRTIADG